MRTTGYEVSVNQDCCMWPQYELAADIEIGIRVLGEGQLVIGTTPFTIVGAN